MIYYLLVSLFVSSCNSMPEDESTRIDLPIYDNPEKTSVYLTEPLESENHGGVDTLSDKRMPGGLNFILGHKVKPTQTDSANYIGGIGLFSPPITTREGALLETEGLGSKALSVKDNVHQFVAGIVQSHANSQSVVMGNTGSHLPKPIVDTIKEEEKYGNDGDKFGNAGRLIVKGAESVSNLVNSAFEVPGAFVKKITRIATEKLNNFGGRLIGLY